MARNALGLTGLLAVSAVTLGVARAWAPPVVLAVAGPYLAFRLGAEPPLFAYAVIWPLVPAASIQSWAVAFTLIAAGAAAYSLVGPRG